VGVKKYTAVKAPGHPKATVRSRGYVSEHILVAERALGRLLPAGAVIHHRDDDGTRNDNDNLVICENQSYHTLIHWRRRVYRAGGVPGRDQLCRVCLQCRPIAEFHRRRRGVASVCRACRRAADRGRVRVGDPSRRRLADALRYQRKKAAAATKEP